jgi:hypothetical protein
VAKYVGQTYNYGTDVKIAVETFTLLTLKLPNDPPTGASESQKRVWTKRIDKYVQREITLKENMKTLYTLIWGQCTDAMRARLEAKISYAAMYAGYDSLELMKSPKASVYNFQGLKYPHQTLHKLKRRFYLYAQDKHMMCQTYLEKFKNRVEVIEHSGGAIGREPRLIDEGLANRKPPIVGLPTADHHKEAEAFSRDACLVITFLLSSDRNRYGALIKKLKNDFIQGKDKCLKNIMQAYHLITNYKNNPKNLIQVLGATNKGVAFTTFVEHKSGKGMDVAMDDNDAPKKRHRGGGRSAKNITCYNCNKISH